MKRLAIILALIAPVAVCGQAITPIHQTCSNKNDQRKSTCQGTFKVLNQGLLPITFAIEPVKLKLENRQKIKQPMGQDLLEVSQTSGRLGPKEARELSFKLHCQDEVECVAQLLIGFMGGHTANGIAVRMILPETIYWKPGSKHPREEMLIAGGILPKK